MPSEDRDRDTSARAERLAQLLEETWAEVGDMLQQDADVSFVDDEELAQLIRESVNSRIMTYRWVLPTQLGIKLVDPTLDARCCQAQRGGPGAHDARSVCAKAIVPFFRARSNVLGGKTDPYVNNPLRVPEITPQFRGQQGHPEGWDKLCTVLARIEEAHDEELTEAAFRQTLLEIRRRLEKVRITYPAPLRLPLDTTVELVEQFISEQSGGVRVQAVGSALFQTLGQKYGFTVVTSAPTAADTPAGRVADVECQYEDGKTFIAIELKDRALVIAEAQDTIQSAREQEVREILFIAQKGLAPQDANGMSELIEAEYVKGQNIYVCDDIMEFARSLLIILGEVGRKSFLDNIGAYLDGHGDYRDRRRYSELLQQA